MSYSLSFAEDFFTGDPIRELGGDDIHNCYPISKRPQCVLQALVSMEKFQPAEFKEMVREVLGYSLITGHPTDETVFFELLEKVREYSTCNTLTPPIQVYLNEDHYVTVYEDHEEEVA